MPLDTDLDLRHELRTPLAAILGLASLLLDSNISDDQRRLVIAMQTAGEHLRSLVDSVMAHHLPPHHATFEVVELTRSIVELFRPEAEAHPLELRFCCDLPNQVRAVGSATYVRQLLVNLVSNAVKFTDTGDVTIRLARCSDGIFIEVADTGPGFDPLSVRPRPDGTGRGLAISHQLAAELGTTIEIASLRGVGTVAGFRLLLA